MSQVAKHAAQRIAERDGGWYCHYCGQPVANWQAGERHSCSLFRGKHEHPNGLCIAHKDHVTPRAHGGSNRIDNLVLACWPCNTAKRALMYLEFITGWRQMR